MAIIFTIKERILQLAKYKGLTNESFCEKIDISYANLKGKAKTTPINSNSLANILTYMPEVNMEWLLTGTGEMFKLPHQTESVVKVESVEAVSIYKGLLKEKEQKIDALNREIGNLQHQIELLKNAKPPDELIEMSFTKLKPVEIVEKV